MAEVSPKLHRITKRFLIMGFCVLAIAPVAGKSLAGSFLNSRKICVKIGEPIKVVLADTGWHIRDVALYHDNGSIIASWKNETIEEGHIDDSYRGRVFMDKKRIIRIYYAEKKDAGKYKVKFGLEDKLVFEVAVEGELPTEEKSQECQNNQADSPKEDLGQTSEKCWITFKAVVSVVIFVSAVLVAVFVWMWYRNDKKMPTVAQVRSLLNIHPDVMKKLLDILTEADVESWLNNHPDFKKKLLEKHNFQMKRYPKKILSENIQHLEPRPMENFTDDNENIQFMEPRPMENFTDDNVVPPIITDNQKANPEGDMEQSKGAESIGVQEQDLDLDEERQKLLNKMALDQKPKV